MESGPSVVKEVYSDEHVPALGSEEGIWEALRRVQTALDEY